MTISEIQKILKDQGYDVGTIDGLWGTKSREAAKAFQRAHGLPDDGVVGPKTLAALRPDLTEKPAGMLTHELIHSVCPNARDEIVDALVTRPTAFQAAGIVTKLRMSHFLAEITPETRYLTSLEENLNYTTASRLKTIWPTRFKNLKEAQLYVRNPQGLANFVYGGRMGNNRPGDGWAYRGGGMGQTTGRNNYREAGYENNPDDLRKMPGALDSALVFWMARGMNKFADADNITQGRRVWNGGLIGIKETREYLAKWKKALGV